jgi:hypothetical protein
MASYGIKPTPEGYEEAQAIINAMRAASGAGVSPYRSG